MQSQRGQQTFSQLRRLPMFEEGREVLEPKQKHSGAFNGLPSSCD